MDLKEVARKHALKNAFDYGKAEVSGIVGKVIAELPEAKNDMKAAMQVIQKIIAEVNKLEKGEIGKQLKNYSFPEKKEEGEKRLKLENALAGRVVTRFLPEPNGYLHIGHAKAAFLSYEAARQYDGKCLLRFDDTNPEKETQEFVEAIKEDLKWLGLSFPKEFYTSDKMPELYKYSQQLIEKQKAYICTCSKEEINKNRFEKRECKCRNRSEKENLVFWEKMKSGKVEKGEMILRLKADMQSDNTVMRDPSLFRIIKSTHYRQGDKYSCWPTYDFEASISDSIDGVTHALRSKEYELRDELYYAILDALGLRKPMVYDFARLNIKGTLLSKRFLKPLIDEKKVLGWDDPRLPTLRGFKRRGILPEAIKQFVLSMGMSKVESQPSMEQLLQVNRKLLDPVAKHYFFVPSPILLKLPDYHGVKEVKIGKRSIKCECEFYVPKADFDSLKKGEVFRLKEHFNVKVLEKKKNELVGEFAGEGLIEGKKVQWVSALPGEFVKAEVFVFGDLVNEDGSFSDESMEKVDGFCEKDCLNLKEGEIVQFERFGFSRLDKKEREKLVFMFSG